MPKSCVLALNVMMGSAYGFTYFVSTELNMCILNYVGLCILAIANASYAAVQTNKY